ncbi:unnamed protein product [Penicillium manginii]
MSKLLVVFGATGQQGGSVIDFVLNDSDLSKEYSLRAITRDATKPAGQALQKRGVEVVSADIDDSQSLNAALAKAHTVFIVTTTVYDEHLKSREFRQGKAAADASVAAGAKYLIFSTSPACEHLWGHPVDSFDSKAEIERYIRELPVARMFMQNFLTNQIPRPIPGQEGGELTYAIANFISPDAPFPLIEAAKDSGKYIAAILTAPDKYVDSILSAATGFYSYREAAEIITRITGRKTIYAQIPQEQWTSYLPPNYQRPMGAMMCWIEKPGYYGPQSKELVEWTVKQARGKLTSLEEFVEEHAKEMFPQ